MQSPEAKHRKKLTTKVDTHCGGWRNGNKIKYSGEQDMSRVSGRSCSLKFRDKQTREMVMYQKEQGGKL